MKPSRHKTFGKNSKFKKEKQVTLIVMFWEGEGGGGGNIETFVCKLYVVFSH